jgi:hypothetical protein
MELVVDPELTARFPARRQADLVLRLDDGSEVRSGPTEASGEPGDGAWEQVVEDKVRAFLDPTAALPLPEAVEPPAGLVAGRTREGLMDLLTFGLRATSRRGGSTR